MSEPDETTALLPRVRESDEESAILITENLEILDRQELAPEQQEQLSNGENGRGPKPNMPMAYAEQIFMEPVSYGTWQASEPPSYIDQDDNKDLVSFVFIMMLGILCVAVIFYPFSYYDDDDSSTSYHRHKNDWAVKYLKFVVFLNCSICMHCDLLEAYFETISPPPLLNLCEIHSILSNNCNELIWFFIYLGSNGLKQK